MLLPSSREFIDLCQAQVMLLHRSLGASWVAVYLAEELLSVEALGHFAPQDQKIEKQQAHSQQPFHFFSHLATNFIPVVIYPDSVYDQAPVPWQETYPMRQLSGGHPDIDPSHPDPAPSLPRSGLTPTRSEPWQSVVPLFCTALPADGATQTNRPQPVILPLVHEGIVLGMLVTGREDRPWSDWEQGQIEPIAQTLGLACTLDQRSQWLEQQHHQQEILQERQHDLLDNLLHQFRNPLTALRTFSKLLLRRLLAEDPNREVAQSILAESNRLQELLQQFDQAIDPQLAGGVPLLAPSRDTATNPPLSPPLALEGQMRLQPCRLIDILQPLLISAAAIAQERQLHLHTQLPETLGLVQTDPSALREVLSNLLDNALKYTPTNGHVVLQSQDDFQAPGATELTPTPDATNWQTILISDTGPGIPIADQPHLFERRYRGVQAEGDIPGTGLGLAIARDLIRQMHGQIQVFSPALAGVFPADILENQEGQRETSPGTTVMVQLPRV